MTDDDDILDLHGRAWAKGDFELVKASKLKPEPIRWLWPQWLAQGKLQLLAGSPGTGKTTIAVSLAAAITTGRDWPGGGAPPVGDVLFWSGEDGTTDTLLPRFLASGGDPDRLRFAGDVTEGRRSRPFDPAADLPRLVAAARELPELRLVVLDPVVSVLTGDSHKNGETRRDLQPVVNLATELDVAVIGITHLSKGTSGREPLERVVGSIAFSAVARIVLATVKSRDPQQPHRLIRAKSNLGADRGGIEYQLVKADVPGHDFHAQRVDWGKAIDGSAHELMSIEDEEEGTRGEMHAFLIDLLTKGPLAVREVKAAAEANGYSWRTLQRAKTDLAITTSRGPEGGTVYYWALAMQN